MYELGGYVNGTVMNADRIPPAPAVANSGSPPEKRRYRACSERGSDSWRIRRFPCPAGFIPVRNDDHAVGVNAGNVDRSAPNAPEPASAASVGRRPSHIKLRTRS